MATWASESLQLARMPEVEYCVMQGDRCNYTADQPEYIMNEATENEGKKVLSLSRDYENQFHETVKRRLKMAGVHLGHLLKQRP